MDEQFYKKLGKTAADEFVKNNTPLTDSVTKLAKQHELNAHQIARVCESANLDTYVSKMASADTRTQEFELADRDVVLDRLSIDAPVDTAKTAAVRLDGDINYFVKSASIKSGCDIYAPEYEASADFLNKLDRGDSSEDIFIKAASSSESIFAEHAKKRAAIMTNQNKIKLAKKITELNAELMVARIKLAAEIDEGVRLIKQASMSSNPFLIWPDISGESSDIADALFTKAAEELAKHNPKKTSELLMAVKEAAKKTIDDREIKVVRREPIIKVIDNISNFRKIIDKIEKFKACGGINEPSSTPNANVAYSVGKKQPAEAYYKKLIEGGE